MKPIVTIGICMHNCENTVGQAIKSICAQDFPHEKMQVIFVDDGSTDNTLKVVEAYLAKIDIPAKVFQTEWRGIASARNIIIENADGKYIIWVDADEVLTPNYIRKQVELMEKNPDVGITCGIVGLVPQNMVLNLELLPGIIGHVFFNKLTIFRSKIKKTIGTGGATFRVSALRQVGGFNTRFKGAGEDVDVLIRICNSGWRIKLNDGLFYELHNGMSTFVDLFKKYYWYGYGCQQLYAYNKEAFSILRMSPILSFLVGLIYSFEAYKLYHKKWIFILPIHYEFKMIAWSLGFIHHQIKNWKAKIVELIVKFLQYK
jgi:glycosyltransferase involved in cell wall biosynthesis